MTPVIVFDDGLGHLGPLTDLRAAFDVRTGALTTLERLGAALGERLVGVAAPDDLLPLLMDRAAAERGATDRTGPEPARAKLRVWRLDEIPPAGTLLINGRCVLPAAEWDRLERGRCITEGATGDVVAVVADGVATIADLVRHPAEHGPVEMEGRLLLSRPWHVRTFRDAALRHDLRLLTARVPALGDAGGLAGAPGSVVLGAGGVAAHGSARIGPACVLDAENGPIVLAEGVVVRPACTLIGPCYVGPGSTVLDRAIVKANTAIGPQCKIAGEVGGSIFQGFANKAHDGHLGDSWVGEWANLGAGTTNSNLLNTYGEVVCRATPGSPNERTGEQFLGAVVGDHVKTAICTRIMTGAIVGTGVMWAATAAATGTTARFAWVTDKGTSVFALEKFTEIARTAMARRKVVPTPAYVHRLGELWRRQG